MADATRWTERRILRPLWLLGCLSVSTALVAVPFAGSARADDLVPGTPCARGTNACVQLGSKGFGGTAWLIEGDHVVRGPVKATTGGPGEDTPTGTFRVLSKDRDHVSSETKNAEGRPSPMPYSVFYTSSGNAFHGGGSMSTRTAGCIRLANEDASYFFRHLRPGDTVQVVPRGSERASNGEHRSHDDGHGGGLLGGL